MGSSSMYSNTTGSGNVGIGTSSLYANTTGSNNVAIGYATLGANTTGYNNTIVGYQSFYSTTVAGNNVAIGYQAGYSFVGTGGSFNTFVGNSAGYNVTTGVGNTFVGGNYTLGGGSGYYMTTGNYNTIVGGFSGNQNGVDLRTSSNYIVLSDGVGNPNFYIDGTPQIYLKQSGSNNQFKAIKQSYMGYSNTYGALVLGSTTQNQTICMNIDPSSITGGSFAGTGSEMLWKRGFTFIIPNAGGTDFQTLMSWSGQSVTIAGSLSKGSGSFRIDHPLPELEETHQLVHSFVEAPQADLIYRGVVTLVAGNATVNIDTAAGMTEGTFEVLCRDVQCFTTNESDWVAVRGKVVGNILTIEAQDAAATSTVSWMVIGERKDKHMLETEWTDGNGKVIVEPLKPVENKASHP
jgi:hypothetical protein